MEEKVQDVAQSALVQNMAIINQIVAEMKEIPILPSEQPKDVSALLKVEFLEKGGVLTWMEGHNYPYKGFPFYEFVDKIDYMKKISRGFLSSLFHSLKIINKFWFITIIPALWISKHLVKAFVYVFYRMIERFRIKSIRYCDSVRELYRAFSYEDDNESKIDREYRLQIRDLICSVLEFDNAYRFRFQDIIEDLNKKALEKNSINEILRLLEIMIQREKQQDIKDTWTLVKLAVNYLKYDKTLLKFLTKTLLRLEVGKVVMDENDKHWCEKRQDYNFKHYECNRILS